MLVVYSEDHKLRDAETELYGGKLVKPFERPSRMEHIVSRIHNTGLGEIVAPKDHGLDPVLKIHDADYLTFLENAWNDWVAEGMEGEAIPTCWPARRMVQKCPDHIDGKLGYYSMAAETAISKGTWEAARASANVALEGALRLADQQSVFSLCRPPGHHAAIDMYGGYCFFNNAAVAAQSLLDNGCDRVAILDVDFHHGNGTQDIFYKRKDVLFVSLHGQPENAFPHFLGYADETGEGEGDGYTLNLPMPPGTRFEPWQEALFAALSRIGQFKPDALVVSLGVDTFENDPISFFKLKSDDFTIYGEDLGRAGYPTLFVMEGGYDIDEIGVNTVNVLQGFESA